MTLRAAIIEDEEIARRELESLLGAVEWVTCIGAVGDGRKGLELLERERPDVVFLDIELPEMNGLELLGRITYQPAVIFTTAYDQYAVTAFELGGVDYLLKPFGVKRLMQALARVADEPQGEAVHHARSILDDTEPLARFFVRSGNRLLPVSVSDIVRIEARGDYVQIHTDSDRHLVQIPISEMERRLDPRQFLRVHRSHIVALDHIRAIQQLDAQRLEVLLSDGSRIAASRTRSRQLRDLTLRSGSD